MSDFLETVSRVVPVAFYDLVARICPGAAFLFLTGFPSMQVSPASDPDQSVQAIPLLIGGYIVGILLTVIGSLVFDGSLELIGKLPGKRFKRLAPHLAWEKIDSLGLQSEKHGLLLVKVEAEITLCQNLFIAFGILAILQSYGYLTHRSVLFDFTKPVSWCVGLTLLAAVIHRTGILIRRVDTIERLLPAGIGSIDHHD